MAKPRKRQNVGKIPTVADMRRKSGNAGKAHESNVIGGTPPKRQPTNWTKYQRPEGFNRDQYGTWRLDEGVEAIGGGTGTAGEYGFHRLEGSQAGEALADAKKKYSAATIKRMEEWAESGDVSRFLYFRTNSIGPDKIPARRPRTKLAGYDGRSKTITILFAHKEDWDSLDGPIYQYFGVPYNVWRMVKRNVSTGRTINRVLNAYPYAVLRPDVAN